MCKLLGLALAAFLCFAPHAQAQTTLDTSHVVRCNPLTLNSSTDYILTTRTGSTCNAQLLPGSLPIATASANGVVHPDNVTIIVDSTGKISTVISPSATSIGSVTTANPSNSGETTSGFYTPAANSIAIELNGAPAMRWKTLASGVDYLTITPGKSGTNAKIGIGGTTTNQGLDLTSTGSGSIGINGVAFSNAGVMTAGTWQGNVIQPTYLAVSTSTAQGIGRPDNSTLSVTGGVWSTIGSGSTSISGTTSAVDYNLIFATTNTGSLPLYSTTSVSVNASTKAVTAGAFNATTSTSAFQINGLNTVIYPNGDNTSIAVGNSALNSMTGAGANTAIGYHAGDGVTSGTSNTFVGNGIAASGTETGVGNTVVGKGSATTITSGAGNAVFGYLAGVNSVTAINNTIIGSSANEALSSTISAVAVGYAAIAGSKDVAIGVGALSGTTTNNNQNTAVGFNSGKKITTGTNNVVVGPLVASTTLTIGSNNILIGTSSALDTSTSNISNYFAVQGTAATPLMWATSTNATAPVHITGGIFATTTGDDACTGCVGEYISSEVLVGSAVPLTNSVASNITSITLTPGDWDVRGIVDYNPNGSTVTTVDYAALSSTSSTLPTAPAGGAFSIINPTNAPGNLGFIPVLPTRFALSSTTTVYLIAESLFSVSTSSAFGGIYARRVR